jgi:hypothetical protein
MKVKTEVTAMTESAATMVRLVNPLGFPEKVQAALADRLKSMEGKTIGLIDNIKPNAGLFLGYIEEMIKADYPTVQFHKVRKNFTSSRLIADQLQGKVQAVVNAWGD